MLSLIVSIAHNNVIGKNNQLLWHLKDDLKRFRKLTKGKTIVMGLNTYLSIKAYKKSKGKTKGSLSSKRTSVVLTNDKTIELEKDVIPFYTFEDLLDYLKDKDAFIIGGAMIYKLFINHVDKLYITKVEANVEGDVFFPKVNWDNWKLIESEKHLKDEKNDYDFEFQVWERK